MSLKKKLVTTIGMFCMTIALLMVGVWAVSSTQIEIGGTISFNASNVNAIVTGSITGASGGDITPNQLVYSSEDSPSLDDLNTWKNDLVFDKDGTDIVMTINVENKSDERALYVSISDSIGTTTATMDKILKQGANPYTAGSLVKIDPETTKSFTITFDITNRDVSTEVEYGYLVNLVDETEVDDGLEATISTGSNSTEYSKEDGETSAVHTFTTTAQDITASTPATTDYTITNNSTTEAMIVEPNFVATEDAQASAYEVEAQSTSANITSKVYFSFDEGATFSILAEKYITVPAGSSVVVRVRVEATIDTTYSATLNLGLYTQVSCPSDYATSYTYSIVDGKGYKTAEGSTTAVAMAEDEYIIVTPETVQSVLDSQAISNKVIIFDEGIYENLNLRPGDNDETTEYKENHNKRTITNVIFAGTEGAKFTGDFACQVTGTNHMNIDGIEFTGMNFTNENMEDETPGCLKVFYNTSAEVGVDICKNVSVNNCSFIALFNDENNNGKFDADSEQYVMTKQYDYQWQNSVAVTFYTSTLEMAGIFYENISYKNNYVEGYYGGLRASAFNNYEVIGNTIKNTEHNGIGIQSEKVNKFTGTVKVLNNIIDGCLATLKDPAEEIGERAIRVGEGVDTDIYIENNSFANCGQYAPGDTEAELLKATSLTNGSFYFVGNTYEGVAIEDKVLAKGTHSSIVITIPVASL